MFARLHVVLSSEKEEDIQEVKHKLLAINKDFSMSPSRDYSLLKDHSEFYVTFEAEENDIQSLLNQLNNDWDGEIDSCSCYVFNTKMFHPLVYCLDFDVFE